MYQSSRRNSFERDVKGYKKNKPLMFEIKDAVQTVVSNPDVGEEMTKNWKSFRNYHFGRKPEMRLIYVIIPCCKDEKVDYKCQATSLELDTSGCEGIVEFIFVKSREECNNLYTKDKKYTEGLLGE